MADATANFSLPYLELGDAPDLASGTQDLAEATDTALTGLDTRLDTLESSPAWTAYTPTWLATSNPVLGNGSKVGFYRQIGKLVAFRIRIVIGTTTTIGSGAYRFGYPVTAKTADALVGCTGWYLQGSSPAGVVGIGFNTTEVRMLTMSSNSYSGPTVPFALASGNEIVVGGIIEAA